FWLAARPRRPRRRRKFLEPSPFAAMPIQGTQFLQRFERLGFLPSAIVDEAVCRTGFLSDNPQLVAPCRGGCLLQDAAKFVSQNLGLITFEPQQQSKLAVKIIHQNRPLTSLLLPQQLLQGCHRCFSRLIVMLKCHSVIS